MMNSAFAGTTSALRSPIPVYSSTTGNAAPPRNRRAPRVAHRATCRVFLPEFAPTMEIAGETRDISREGLSVVLSQTIPPGVLLEAHFFAPDGEPSRVRGRVVYCRRVMADQYELGIATVARGEK